MARLVRHPRDPSTMKKIALSLLVIATSGTYVWYQSGRQGADTLLASLPQNTDTQAAAIEPRVATPAVVEPGATAQSAPLVMRDSTTNTALPVSPPDEAPRLPTAPGMTAVAVSPLAPSTDAGATGASSQMHRHPQHRRRFRQRLTFRCRGCGRRTAPHGRTRRRRPFPSPSKRLAISTARSRVPLPMRTMVSSRSRPSCRAVGSLGSRCSSTHLTVAHLSRSTTRLCRCCARRSSPRRAPKSTSFPAQLSPARRSSSRLAER
jgi:hypothetical protein